MSDRNGDAIVGVAITDSGPGIVAEVAQRLFQPFTIPNVRGTGVGMWLCRGIAEARGVQLWA